MALKQWFKKKKIESVPKTEEIIDDTTIASDSIYRTPIDEITQGIDGIGLNDTQIISLNDVPQIKKNKSKLTERQYKTALFFAEKGLVNAVSQYLSDKGPTEDQLDKILDLAYVNGIEQSLKLAEYYASLGNIHSHDSMKDLLKRAKDFSKFSKKPLNKVEVTDIKKISYRQQIINGTDLVYTFHNQLESILYHANPTDPKPEEAFYFENAIAHKEKEVAQARKFLHDMYVKP